MTIQANFPAIKPSLLLDFANTKQLDSRITYTRASTASFYNGVTTAKAEENLMTYSQEIDNAAWVKVECTVTANTVAAPDGTTTAETLLETTANQYHAVYQLPALAVNQTYCISAYFKKNTRKYAAIGLGFNASNGLVIQVDLDAGTIAFSGSVGTGYSIVSSAISSVGSGWYRVSAVVTNGTNAGTFTLGSGGATLWTANTFQGNAFVGTTSDGIYVWGAQVEQRSAVTAYTATTTQAITNYIPALQTAASGVARFDNNPTTGESLGLLIEEQRTNVVLQSQFASGWSATRSTLSPNQIIAPDGTLTGANLIENTDANSHFISQSISISNSTAYTGTFYAKAGSKSWATLWITNIGTSANTYFDLQNGVLGTVPSGVTATITSVGNGWYRCSVSGTSVSTGTNFYIGTASANNTNTAAGNGFSGIFIWGAQLEAGAFATSYIPTVASQVTRAADAASMTGTNFSTWYNNANVTFYIETTPSSVSRPFFNANDNSGTNSILPYLNTGGPLSVYSSSSAGTQQLDTGVSFTNQNTKIAFALTTGSSAASINGGSVSTGTVKTMPQCTQLTIGTSIGVGGTMTSTIKKLAYYPIKVTNAQLQALTS